MEEELERMADGALEGSGIEESVQLKGDHEQLEEKLSKSERKRRSLISKLRKIKPGEGWGQIFILDFAVSLWDKAC